MTEAVLRKKIQRMQLQIDALEKIIEDRSREIFTANQKLEVAVNFLQEIYEMMPEALLVFDHEGNIKAINGAATALLAYTEAELQGQHIDTVFVADEHLELERISALAVRNKIFRTEKTCITKDGNAVPVLVSATTLVGTTQTDQVHDIVCLIADIRDRKQLEIELRQAQKLESVGRLAAGVAHEINTPIQFVSDSIHFVQESMLDLFALLEKLLAVQQAVITNVPALEMAEQAAVTHADADVPYLLANMPKALERSVDGLSRVAAIVRSMKEFAHPDQREMAAVNLNQAIESTLVISKNEYKYVADVETQFGELPFVTCHIGDINQVILNLIVNAAHAIADVVRGTDQKGRIMICTAREGDYVRITISDTGGGIPNNIHHQIFDPFFTTKGVGKGTGQGLAIARSIVMGKHNGELSFTTEMGKGTTFIIRLPIQGAVDVAGVAA